MITTSKWLGIVAVAFVAGSFIASPELRAFAAATVGSAEIIDNSIQSIDIKDAEVKTPDLRANAVTSPKILDGTVSAADLGTDSVGASELQGVTKLTFAECSVSNTGTIFSAGGTVIRTCSVAGASTGDNVSATKNSGSLCFPLTAANVTAAGTVSVYFTQMCPTQQTLGVVNLSILVYNN